MVLAVEINASHEAVQHHYNATVIEMMTAGDRLIEAKSLVDHGRWLPWLKERCPRVSERTASNYMRLAKWRAEIEAAMAEVKSATVADFERPGFAPNAITEMDLHEFGIFGVREALEVARRCEWQATRAKQSRLRLEEARKQRVFQEEQEKIRVEKEKQLKRRHEKMDLEAAAAAFCAVGASLKVPALTAARYPEKIALMTPPVIIPAAPKVVAPDEELGILRELAAFVLIHAVRPTDPKDDAEFGAIVARVKAINSGKIWILEDPI
jgi:hypothetical protein